MCVFFIERISTDAFYWADFDGFVTISWFIING
jgi:hypothetical protein